MALGVQHHIVQLQIPEAETRCEHLCTCILSLWICDHFGTCCCMLLSATMSTREEHSHVLLYTTATSLSSLSAAHMIHWETNNNILAMKFKFMSQLIFFPSFTTSGSYICHKVVSGCQTQGWWDMKRMRVFN